MEKPATQALQMPMATITTPASISDDVQADEPWTHHQGTLRSRRMKSRRNLGLSPGSCGAPLCQRWCLCQGNKVAEPGPSLRSGVTLG